MTKGEYLSAITPDELLSAPSTEGEKIAIYTGQEFDRFSMVRNSIETARALRSTRPWDKKLLRGVIGGGFGAYLELASAGLGFEAREILIEEGITEDIY